MDRAKYKFIGKNWIKIYDVKDDPMNNNCCVNRFSFFTRKLSHFIVKKMTDSDILGILIEVTTR